MVSDNSAARVRKRLPVFGLLMVVVATTTIAALEPHFPFGLAEYDWAFHLAAFSIITMIAGCLRLGLVHTGTAVIMLSALIEVGQNLIPTRTASIQDMLVNLAGVALGLAALVLWRAVRSGGSR